LNNNDNQIENRDKSDAFIPSLSLCEKCDPSFVFFQENHGAPAQGSLTVPLTAERSIATDKSLMPPGALALIRAAFPFVIANSEIEHRIVSRYVLDQDTGGAIKGAGRVDYFLGTGKIAGERAGVTVSNGQLFYLLLKPTP
jgi:membrane-bound lytic murein transglycosylase A